MSEYLGNLRYLVDSRCTATSVSKKRFQSIKKEKRPRLIPMRDKVRGVNGRDIDVIGIADIPLELGGVCFFQRAIVCGILPDGILGRDFSLLKFATHTDYKKMLIETSVNTIPYWVGGESVSNVVLQDSPNSPHGPAIILLLIYPNRIHCSTQASSNRQVLLKSKEVCFFEGIIDTSSRQATVYIVNIGESEVTIFFGTPVGSCESYYEKETAGT